jgi:hypothetical protein
MGYSCEDIKMAINVLPSDTLLGCLKEHVADLGEQGVNLFRCNDADLNRMASLGNPCRNCLTMTENRNSDRRD